MAPGDLNAQPENAGFEQAWNAVRADRDIQFVPAPEPAMPEMPDWWKATLDFLAWLVETVFAPIVALGEGLGLTTRGTLIALGVIVALALAVLVWRMIARRAPAAADPAGEEAWTPDADDARALLAEADRLAAAGHYDEATHILLRRAIGQIETALPGLIDPSTTAREIAGAAALPHAARRAFAAIAAQVERSLFARRRLEAKDWREARAAYADFALPGTGAGTSPEAAA